MSGKSVDFKPLPLRKRISRSLESIVDKSPTFTGKREARTPYSDPPTSRKTRIPAPRINLDSEPSSGSESSVNLIVQREFPINIADFSLLNMPSDGDNQATGNVTVLKALSLVKDFSGESASELTTFIKSCEIALQLVSAGEQPLLLRAILGTKFKKRAALELEYRDIESFEALKALLLALFKEKRSLCAVQSEFNACRQRDNENVRSFAARLEKLTLELSQLISKPGNSNMVNKALIESVNEQAINVFSIGLKEKLRVIIRSRTFDTLRAAITAAIEEEQALGPNNGRSYGNYGGAGFNRDRIGQRYNEQKCERCHRQGHLAKNCYTRLSMPRPEIPSNRPASNRQSVGSRREMYHATVVCNYCKKPGHVQRDCRTLMRVNNGEVRTRNSEQTTNYRRDAFRNTEDRSFGNAIGNRPGRAGSNERPTLESYQINCTSGVSKSKNIVEIEAKEIKCPKIRMLVDTGADITLLKYSKIIGKVRTTREVITLRGIGNTDIPTICKIELNVKIGAGFVRHPCHVVKDDFPLQVDGILGYDFITKYKAIIRPGVRVEILDTQWPLVQDEKIIIQPRTEAIIRAHTKEHGDGLVEKQRIEPGIYIGNCLTSSDNGTCPIPIINMTNHAIQLQPPTVQLETFSVAPETDLLDDSGSSDCVSKATYDIRVLTGKDRMRTLRDNIKTEHLNEEEKASLMELCEKYNDIFYLEGDKLGFADKVKHKIRLIPGAKPVNVKPYRLPQVHKEEVDKQVKEMIEQGIIGPSTSEWNAPLLVVAKKPDESGRKRYRVVVDFRKLNEITVGDSFPLPNISEILDQLGGAKYFSTLDLASGFHQIAMEPEDCEKTAFSTTYGHYEYKRMPFGLKGAPPTFQRTMEALLGGLRGIKCFVYIDDIVIHGRSLKEHQERLAQILERIRKSGLKLQPNKCQFLRKETIYLGHVITEDGIKPDPSKLDVVKNYPVPKKAKDLQSFLGLAGYYRKFIKNFSYIARPLTQLLKKDAEFRWTDQEQEAFQILKEKLTSAPLLQYPDFSKPFTLTTDASGKAIGAILSQQQQAKDLPIAYASRVLNKAEINYSTTEKELLAIVWATQHFRPYLYGTKFTIVTDHKPLTWLFNVKDPGSRLIRWRLKLEEYDYVIRYKEGKTNQNADALSRMYVIKRGRGRPRKSPPTDDPQAASDSSGENDKNEKDELESSETDEDDKKEKIELESSETDEDDTTVKNKDKYTEEEKKQILYEYHDTPLGGHVGMKRTVKRIQLKHSWPGLRQDVEKYISKCEKCQKNKLHKATKAPMIITDTPVAPFEKCALDIVGPLPESNNRNKYVLTFQDLLTKFSKAIPLPDQEANTIAKEFVTKIVCEYGIPKKLITDQGTNFLSQIFKDTCKLLRIDKIQTTAYHPESNGALERSHRTLAEYLKNFVDEDQSNWDEWLSYAMFTYNTTPHTATGYTPYELVFGRQAELPTSLRLAPQPDYTYDRYAHELKQRLRSTNVIARDTINNRKLRSKQHYDKRATDIKFKPGDRVLLRDDTVRRGRAKKLTPSWIGPYTVIQSHANENYTIKKGRKSLRIHTNRLKHFID